MSRLRRFICFDEMPAEKNSVLFTRHGDAWKWIFVEGSD
jgi:hypothetical protein